MKNPRRLAKWTPVKSTFCVTGAEIVTAGALLSILRREFYFLILMYKVFRMKKPRILATYLKKSKEIVQSKKYYIYILIIDLRVLLIQVTSSNQILSRCLIFNLFKTILYWSMLVYDLYEKWIW